MPVQNSISKISAIQIELSYLKYLYHLHLAAYCVMKGNVHFSHVLGDGLVGNILFFTSEELKLKNLHRNVYMSKKEVFRKLSVQKTG